MRRALALLLTLLCASCTPDGVTQILVVIDTDLLVPAQINSLRVDVDGLGGSTMRSIGDVEGPASFPRTVALVHEGGPLGPIDVTVIGFRGGNEVVTREARVSFVLHEIRVLRMNLLRDCVDVDCGAGMTCGAGGACRSAQIAPDELEEWGGELPRFDAGMPGDACLSSELCNGVDDDCDEFVDEGFDLETDVLNCGLCGRVCDQPANATPICAPPACEFMCDAGFDDCDGNDGNGCEADLSALESCGSCGAVCATPNATPTCATRTCEIEACMPGFDDCDSMVANGCEADLDSRATCGRCGVQCTPTQVCRERACLEADALIDIATGTDHTCAFTADGRVLCWGDNAEGQVGNGVVSASSPTLVTGVTDPVDISAGDKFTCVVQRDGRVLCWGKNDRLQQGGMDAVNVPAPRPVPGINDAVAVATGKAFTCVLRRGGEVACFGKNDKGQLGRDTGDLDDGMPVDVGLVDDATQVVAGEDHACALLVTGEVVCWGRNDKGQRGDGGMDGPTLITVTTGLTGVEEIVAGAKHNCARTATEISCWGWNQGEQLGTVGPDDRSTAELITLPQPAVALAAGLEHTCATLTDDSLVCWGKNDLFQLGVASPAMTITPQPVDLGGGTPRVVASYLDHSCAALMSGGARCWGEGADGQLGDGTTAMESLPVVVAWP